MANVSPCSCPGLAEGEVRTLAHLCPMHVLEHEALEHKCERQEHCIKTKDRDLAARHDAEVALRAEIDALAEGRLAFESRIAGAMTMLSMSQKEMMDIFHTSWVVNRPAALNMASRLARQWTPRALRTAVVCAFTILATVVAFDDHLRTHLSLRQD